ncbi:hypothetical protein [Leclercia sp.]|uniref:hypothetical protein n=1 Tax=Leclercia sp. TaxID=1898428 RepID=UPI0028965CF6|nr:hypothetical protein [Leclercia sp.]
MTTNLTDQLKRAKRALREYKQHRESNDFYEEQSDFNPSPRTALGIRAHSINKLISRHTQQSGTLVNYLRALGYVREQIIAARFVLNTKGKKKYEAYVKSTLAELPQRFKALGDHHLLIITSAAAIPFRRSASKDHEEITHMLCLITDCILQYRYKGEDSRYREYADTIAQGVDSDHIPPMIASLIMVEVSSLVNSAVFTGVFPYRDTGLTCEEFARYRDPENFEEEETHETYDVEMAFPVEGIAQQSLWYGLHEEIDDFIISLAGGLLYGRSIS